jgi:hypothetical protein
MITFFFLSRTFMAAAAIDSNFQPKNVELRERERSAVDRPATNMHPKLVSSSPRDAVMNKKN